MGTIIRKLLTPRNLIPSVIILLAFVSAVGPGQILGFDRDQIVLALLGLLAIDALVERLEYLERIEGKISDVKALLSPKTSAAAFFKDRGSLVPLDKRVEKAREICISGSTLIALATTHIGILKKKWEEGCHLKFLLIDPESESIKLAAAAFSETRTPALHVLHIKTSLGNLEDMLTKSAAGGRAEIRLLNYVPPISLFIIDGAQPYGKIKVELYPYKCPRGETPHFELNRTIDGHWYELFFE